MAPFRLRLTRHLGAPASADPAAQAGDWLRGQGDLLIAGMGGQVPVAVQLGVLAHADLSRLANLGSNRRLGSVRRAWGTQMARLAALQRDLLVPLELEAVGGHAELSTRAGAISYLRSQLPLRAARD